MSQLITCGGRWGAPAFLWIASAVRAKQAHEKRLVEELHLPTRVGMAHASGPSQNHLGSTLIAAAIIRLTSPETASLSPVAEGLNRRYSAVAAARA